MKRFALIGHPLGHSLSPEIHRAIMDSAGIRGTYELIDVAPADMAARVPALLREYDGFNVTIPHKKAVIPFLSGLSDAARRCGAVNTVFEGRGYNTDTVGFRAGGIPLSGASVMLVGTASTVSWQAAVLPLWVRTATEAVPRPWATIMPASFTLTTAELLEAYSTVAIVFLVRV